MSCGAASFAVAFAFCAALAADDVKPAPAAVVDVKLGERLRVVWEPATCTLASASSADGVAFADPFAHTRWTATKFGAPIAVIVRFDEVSMTAGKPEIRYTLALEGGVEVKVSEAIDEYANDDKGRLASWRRFRIGALPYGVVLSQTHDGMSLAASRTLARSNGTWTMQEARFARTADGTYALVRAGHFDFVDRGETIVTVVYG